MTESIAVSSGKGGVGKTTIAVNVALTLAKNGNKTLLLDADLGMANAHLVLGVNPEKSLDDFINKKIPINKISYKINKNLDFISGGSAVHSLLNLENTERYNIIKSFNNIKKTYDYMIIDIGAGADASSISFMSAANKIITVLVSEPTSFADAYSLVKASYLDEKLDNFGIVWNMSNNDFQAKNHFEKFRSISTKFLDVKLTYLGSLHNSKLIKQSILLRKPIIDTQNIKETEYFEKICKNLKNLKSNKNKSIKFFED